jgi:o-succinylbenzoate synthase
MKIVEVTATRLSVPLQRPFVTAVRRTDRVESVVVRLRDADGRCGWGEASHNPKVTGETAAGIEAVVTTLLREAVLGRDAVDLTETTRAVATAVHGNPSAKSAVDCALHDLAAQQLGVPLRVLLGGQRADVPTDITLSVGTPADLADEAAARRAEGFTVFKIKLDGHDDVERVRSIAEAAGPDVRLRIDANQAWTPRQAVTVITALEDAGFPLEFVEQPVVSTDLAGLAWVTARVATPVLADEAVWTASDVVEVARHQAADLVNLKLAKCGGLGPARDFLAAARACGLGVVFGSMMETHIGCAAAANLAAVQPAGPTDRVTDLDPPWLLAGPPVTGGMHIDGPRIALPDAPGLGITDFTGDPRSPSTPV